MVFVFFFSPNRTSPILTHGQSALPHVFFRFQSHFCVSEMLVVAQLFFAGKVIVCKLSRAVGALVVNAPGLSGFIPYLERQFAKSSFYQILHVVSDLFAVLISRLCLSSHLFFFFVLSRIEVKYHLTVPLPLPGHFDSVALIAKGAERYVSTRSKSVQLYYSLRTVVTNPCQTSLIFACSK